MSWATAFGAILWNGGVDCSSGECTRPTEARLGMMAPAREEPRERRSSRRRLEGAWALPA